MYDRKLPSPQNLIKCAEHPAIDPAESPCRVGHPDAKVDAATFTAATKPGGVFEQSDGLPPIRLGHCLKCGSTLTFIDPPADDTQPGVMLWQLRGGTP